MLQKEKTNYYSIEVRNLTKKFGDFTAVDNISFSVKRGEIFAFLGPNGAGKTTTIKMLTTLLHPTTGTMQVNGFDPMTNQDAVKRSFGIVFQDPSLDDELTAYENMEFHGVLYKVPDKILKNKIEDMLNFVELWDRKNYIVKHFSGGMKRRLEIARGLLHTPEVLFMDEAERVADRVAIIDHGKIVAEGNPEDLKEKTGAKTLEDAFLSLTGKKIREEESGSIDQMRMNRKLWSR